MTSLRCSSNTLKCRQTDIMDVQLDRGTSFTLRDAVVIGLRSEKRLAREPENCENSVPVLTAVQYHKKREISHEC